MPAASRALLLATVFLTTLLGGVAAAQEAPIPDGLVQINVEEPTVDSASPPPGSASTVRGA